MVLRQIHVAAAVAFVVVIVVQVFLAGAAIPNLGGNGDFRTHIDVGYYLVGLASLAVVVTALIARRPRREVLIAVGMLVLYLVQTMLPLARSSASWVAALHPVNALLLFGVAVWYARQAWRAVSG
jgi:hypothetical protein